MKQEDFFEVLGELEEQYIVEAEEPVKKGWRRGKRFVFAMVAVAACLCLLFMNGRKITLSERSKGVTVSYVDEAFVPDISAEAKLVWLTEEELFKEWSDVVFKGTVKKIENIKLEFRGYDDYRALAEIQVNKVYRGEFTEGETVTVLLPGAVIEGKHSNSIMDTLGMLEVGMTGIFMPMAYTEESIHKQAGATLYLQDLADYGFGDGIRHAFLETAEGLLFSRGSYIGAKDAVTLEDIEAYVEQMIELYCGADAADSAEE